jgi:hypothetical protein
MHHCILIHIRTHTQFRLAHDMHRMIVDGSVTDQTLIHAFIERVVCVNAARQTMDEYVYVRVCAYISDSN